MIRDFGWALVLVVLTVATCAWAEGPHCNAQDWSGCQGGSQTQEVPKAQHPLLHGYLVTGPPQDENEGEAFAFHYRCTAGRDGTTITLQAVEGGPKVKIACVNCLCSGEK